VAFLRQARRQNVTKNSPTFFANAAFFRKKELPKSDQTLGPAQHRHLARRAFLFFQIFSISLKISLAQGQ